MAGNNEASVEEILESIKKVIARDSSDAGHRGGPRKVTARPTTEPADTHGADKQDDKEVLDLADMELSNLVELEHDAPDEDAPEKDRDEPLVGEDVRGAMRDNLAALAMLAEPGAKPQIVRSGETSLEGLTRELLRPMLAEWLDKHLPDMVEKMVQAEIARIAGKRG